MVIVHRLCWNIFTELNLCLPIRLMITPLKKRFAFHFSGNRRTNRLDRPEWFLTQILTWLRDHLPFLKKYLQPIADGLDMKINVQVIYNVIKPNYFFNLIDN